MPGALLQLISNESIQNRWINHDPEITLFKTVYRRHTPFGIELIDIPFHNQPKYGESAIATIPLKGDLLHTLFLSYRIPTVNAIFPNTKIDDIRTFISRHPELETNTEIDIPQIHQRFIDILDQEYDIIANVQKLLTTLSDVNIILEPTRTSSATIDIENGTTMTTQYSITNSHSIIKTLYQKWFDQDIKILPVTLVLQSIAEQQHDNLHLSITNPANIKNSLNNYVYQTILNNPAISFLETNITQYQDVSDTYQLLSNIYGLLAHTIPILVVQPISEHKYSANIDPNFNKLLQKQIYHNIKNPYSQYLKHINRWTDRLTSSIRDSFSNLVLDYYDKFSSDDKLYFDCQPPLSNIYAYLVPEHDKNMFNLNIYYFYFFKYLHRFNESTFASHLQSIYPMFTDADMQVFKAIMIHIKTNIEYYMFEASYTLNQLYHDIPEHISESLASYLPTTRSNENAVLLTMIYHRSHIPSIEEIFRYIFRYIDEIEIDVLSGIFPKPIPKINNPNIIVIRQICSNIYSCIYNHFVDQYQSTSLQPKIDEVQLVSTPYNSFINRYVSHFLYNDDNSFKGQATIEHVLHQMEFYYIAELINIHAQQQYYDSVLSSKYLTDVSDAIKAIIDDSYAMFHKLLSSPSSYYQIDNLIRYTGKPYISTTYRSRAGRDIVDIEEPSLNPNGPNLDPGSYRHQIDTNYIVQWSGRTGITSNLTTHPEIDYYHINHGIFNAIDPYIVEYPVQDRHIEASVVRYLAQLILSDAEHMDTLTEIINNSPSYDFYIDNNPELLQKVITKSNEIIASYQGPKNIQEIILVNKRHNEFTNILNYLSNEKNRFLIQLSFRLKYDNTIRSLQEIHYANPGDIDSKKIATDISYLAGYPEISRQISQLPSAFVGFRTMYDKSARDLHANLATIDELSQHIILWILQTYTMRDAISYLQKISHALLNIYRLLNNLGLTTLVINILSQYQAHLMTKQRIMSRVQDILANRGLVTPQDIDDMPIDVGNFIRNQLSIDRGDEILTVLSNIDHVLMDGVGSMKLDIIHKITSNQDMDPELARILEINLMFIPDESFHILHHFLSAAIEHNKPPYYFDYDINIDIDVPVSDMAKLITVLQEKLWLGRINNNSLDTVIKEYTNDNRVFIDDQGLVEYIQSNSRFLEKTTEILKSDIAVRHERTLCIKRSFTEFKQIVTRDRVPNFAWIESLGTYLTSYISIKRNGVEIGKMTSDSVNIDTLLSDTKHSGYNKITGNIPALYYYNNNRKEGREIIIPLKFHFHKNVSQSLPLITDSNAKYQLEITLRRLHDVIYSEQSAVYTDDFGEIITPVPFDFKVVGGYVILSKEERKAFIDKPLDYLVEETTVDTNMVSNMKYHSVQVPTYTITNRVNRCGIKMNVVTKTNRDTRKIQVDYTFLYPTTSMTTVFRPLAHVNTDMRNSDDYFPGEKQWNNYGVYPKYDLRGLHGATDDKYVDMIHRYRDPDDDNVGILRTINAVLTDLSGQDNMITETLQVIKESYMDSPIYYPQSTGQAELIDKLYYLDIDIPILTQNNLNQTLLVIEKILGEFDQVDVRLPIGMNMFYKLVHDLYFDRIERGVLSEKKVRDAAKNAYNIYRQRVITQIVNRIASISDINNTDTWLDAINHFYDIYYLIGDNSSQLIDLFGSIMAGIRDLSTSHTRYAREKALIYRLLAATKGPKKIPRLDIIHVIAKQLYNKRIELVNNYYGVYINPMNHVTLNPYRPPALSGYIQLNNQNIMPINSDENYWRTIQYLHYPNGADGVYSYTWKLYTDTSQPNGSVNMSRIQDVSAIWTLDPELSTDTEIITVTHHYNLYRYFMGFAKIFTSMSAI